MKRKQFISFVACLILCLWFGVVFAEPVKWSGNGHYYDVVEDGANMSWEEARGWASGQTYTDASGQLFKGYLATITSLQEDDFIASLHFTQTNYLLGGYQTPATAEANSTEKKADWHWVTGEEWQYTDWRSGEPNNFFRWVGVVGAGQSEEYLQYFPASTSGSWNDVYTGTVTDSDGEHFFGIRNFVVEYEAAASSLMVTVDGVDVSFDWSAMPEANSYVLAVAPADAYGNADMGSLVFLEMGSRTSFYAAGLPSGIIFYVAILAETVQGQVLSDMVKFIPISGSVSFPGGAGGILAAIDDPGGLGRITLFGTLSGNEVNITRLTGDDGTGPFVLIFADSNPVTYTKGGFTMNFKNLADGSFEVESVRTGFVRQSVSDCQEEIEVEMRMLKRYFQDKVRGIMALNKIFTNLGIGTGKTGPLQDRLLFLASVINANNYEIAAKYKNDLAALQKRYDECSEEPEPTPEPTPAPEPTPDPYPDSDLDPQNPYGIDNSCSIPAGAERWVSDYDNSHSEGWSIPGVGNVGPLRSWVRGADDKFFLYSEACYNAAGQNDGWVIFFAYEGKMSSARHYKAGILDGHWYDFFENKNRSLKLDYTYKDGIVIAKEIWNEDGSKKESWSR